MSPMLEVKLRGPGSTPITSQETGHKGRRGEPVQWEATLPRGVKMEDIFPRRYETLAADHSWVHQVRCSLLGLEAGTTPSKEDINTSEWFVP